MKTWRLIFGLLLITIITVSGIYTYLHWDEIIQDKIIITYSDGCKEIYIKGNITTPKCEDINIYPTISYKNINYNIQNNVP